MNYTFIFLILILFKFSFAFAEPNVLKCNKNCGKSDLNDSYSFQARIAMGPDQWGANVTFIEDDIILSQGHILGYSPEEKNSIPRCGSDASSNPAADWLNNKDDMYVVAGKNYPVKIVIGKILDISIRATGHPPGYDIMIAHVDRFCEKCNRNIKILPIPVASKIPPINTKALHIFIPGEDQKNHGKGILSDNHILNGKIWGSKNNSCTRQSIKHDGITNPPMVFDTSGSPVIYKECGKYAVHGLHGNGMDFDGFMYEHLQLLQTQKEWIQNEIYRWTNRKDMLDACSPSGRKSFMAGQSFEVKQKDCGKTFFDDVRPVFCKLLDQSKALKLPDF
tara:strand:+ start:13 stop:1017 length:1005 start_codon:yes stop_codon:yes gene_type:complete